MKKSNFGAVLISVILALTFSLINSEGEKQVDEYVGIEDRIYEMRTYVTHPGKLGDLHERFSNHTVQLFSRHGMVNVGYWVPVDQEDTLIYILSHKSREAAETSWESFRNDPEWQRVYEASIIGGPIVMEIESVFMEAVPYSQIR